MDSGIYWNKLINLVRTSEIEIPTTPQVRRQPLWFRVSTDGHALIINEAKEHAPSSSLKMARKIRYEEFECIYEYYVKRCSSKPRSTKEVGERSLHLCAYRSCS